MTSTIIHPTRALKRESSGPRMVLDPGSGGTKLVQLLARHPAGKLVASVVHAPDREATKTPTWDIEAICHADDNRLKKAIVQARDGLRRGEKPQPIAEGMGGTYLLTCHGRSVAVFKPRDEEIHSPNNPKGSPSGCDPAPGGIRAGEGAEREMAAFLLDFDSFAAVPATTLVRCTAPFGQSAAVATKTGSFQVYVDHASSCEDVGYSRWDVERVHAIGLLDLRLGNGDRHAGNVLVTARDALVPIDHGQCLPRSMKDHYYEWLYWPQTRAPFSAKTRDYIRSLDAESEWRLLEKSGVRLDAATQRTFRIRTAFVKKGVEMGLTLHQLARLACRRGGSNDGPSQLEDMVACIDADDEGFHVRFEAALEEQIRRRVAAL